MQRLDDMNRLSAAGEQLRLLIEPLRRLERATTQVANNFTLDRRFDEPSINQINRVCLI